MVRVYLISPEQIEQHSRYAGGFEFRDWKKLRRNGLKLRGLGKHALCFLFQTWSSWLDVEPEVGVSMCGENQEDSPG